LDADEALDVATLTWGPRVS